MRIQPQYMSHIDHPSKAQVIHNTYLQMLTDSGVFAFGLYIVLLFGTIFWLGRSAKRMWLLDPQLAHVPMALQAALITFAVGSTFLSRVNFDLTYYLLTAAAAWLPIERQRFRRAEDEEEALAESPASEVVPA
jgi:O-antigen ligase